MQVQRRRGIASHALCRDDHGRVLLVRAAPGAADAGLWRLPGGVVAHGEHPEATLRRTLREQVGSSVSKVALTKVALADVLTEVEAGPDAVWHLDRLIFSATLTPTLTSTGGALVPGDCVDAVSWLGPADWVGLPLKAYAASLLGVPADAPAWIDDGTGRDPVPGREFQRFAAYGLVTDPVGNVLLTRIATGFPGAGRWHLPGGGTDFGEPADAAFTRELREETDQIGRIERLIEVSHRHHRDAIGPEGFPIDWHGVRVVFRAVVAAPTPARVVEGRGGSTAAAAWMSVGSALDLTMTEIAHEMISKYLTSH